MDGHCCLEVCATCESCTGPGGTCVEVRLRSEDTVPSDACSGDYWCVEGSRCEQKAQVVVGDSQTCALLADGNVRCWGSAGFLGYGNYGAEYNIGDDELPRSAGNVDVGGRVVELAAGSMATCAILETGGMRCWGPDGVWLGYGGSTAGSKPPAVNGDLPLGARAIHIAATHLRICVLLDGGAVRCWGENQQGELGTSGTGDRVFVSKAPLTDIQLGEPARQIALGRASSCAITVSGNLRCWGNVATDQPIGDNEPPESAGIVTLGEPLRAVAPGWMHMCGVTLSGALRCWDSNATLSRPPQLAREPGALIDIGATVQAIGSGDNHSCILGSAGQVRCWGRVTTPAVLGYPGYAGQAESARYAPDNLGDVEVGEPVEELAVGNTHTCALLSNARIRCWGYNRGGLLGYGHTNDIGDDEPPAAAGDVPYL